MHDQTTAPAMQRIADVPADSTEDQRQHPIAVLSATVVKAARTGYRESQADLAERAGTGPDVVCRAEDGTQPAWALPYEEFAALADAVSVLNPWLRDWFETAAACDLLLTCVLDGDQVLVAEVLAEPGSRYLAKKLLRWAITGVLPTRSYLSRPLLGEAEIALLKDRAAALASSGSPDAWVGAEILSAYCSSASDAQSGGQQS